MLAGKQREIQERHELFLKIGRAQLLEEGYHGLSIGRIAEATGFSKGTVYQRFACKEELIVELGRRCRDKLRGLIERSAGFPGRPRERMLAVGQAFEYLSRDYPDDMRILSIITAEAILERVPEEQRSRMDAMDARIFGVMLDIVHDAIEQGDLALTEDTTAERLCLSVWALADGYFAASTGSAPLDAIGITEPLEEIARTGHYLLDGYGWRPLKDEWDYDETSRRIQSTVFVERNAVCYSVKGGDKGFCAFCVRECLVAC